MAISEQLQQRINNLTQGNIMDMVGKTQIAISPEDWELDQQSLNNMSMNFVDQITGPTKGVISNREMDLFRDASPRMGLTRADGLNTMPATPELTKPEIALERIKDIARNVEDPDELQRLFQVIHNMSEQINQSKGAISNKEMEMFRDASPPSYIQLSNGQDTQVVRDNDPRINQFIEAGYRMVPPPSTSINVGPGDSFFHQETQQAIDALQQELQMTTDPEEAEGIGGMIAKLSAEMMAPLGGVAKQVAQAGGGEDTALAHVRPGEIVLPPEMMEDPQFEAIVEEKFNQFGINPEEAVVGMGIASLNQSTGLEEFGFFKKLGKKLGKVVKKVAPVAMLVPGVGTALGGVLGGIGGLATKIPGIGGALGSLGSSAMSMVANAGIPGLSSIAGGTAGGFSSIGKGLGSMKGLLGDGPLSGFLGGGDLTIQPGDTLNEIAAKNNTTVAEIMKANPSITDPNMIQAGATLKMPGGGNFNLGRALTGGAGRTPDMIKSIEDTLKGQGGSMFGGGQGGSMFGGGQGGRLGALGTAGLVGLAGALGKMAYDETKKDKGVPLTPLNTMNAAGRFNLEAEIARRMGQQAPNPVEFGLLPQGTFPELSGGQPAPVAMNMGGYVMPMQYAEGGNVAVEDFERQNGMINGMGTETSDDVPAMLSDGEFVMTGQAVRGAGSYEMEQGDGGILTLIPSLDEDRERGTELMYNMMEVFSNRANAS